MMTDTMMTDTLMTDTSSTDTVSADTFVRRFGEPLDQTAASHTARRQQGIKRRTPARHDIPRLLPTPQGSGAEDAGPQAALPGPQAAGTYSQFRRSERHHAMGLHTPPRHNRRKE